MNIDDFFSEGVNLKDACPNEFAQLFNYFLDKSKPEIANQLNDLFIPRQVLTGVDDDFSFMAYPVPRLTQEQLKSAVFREEESLHLKIDSMLFEVVLDNFGKINWFYVKCCSEMYWCLKKCVEP